MKLAVVSAGTGRPSSTGLLADRLTASAVRALGGDAEVQVVRVELRDLATEIAHAMVTGFPGTALRQALDQVTGAAAVIAVTPVYSASYSGLFKSFFDVVAHRSLTGTPVIIGATGGTPRHSLVLDHALRPLFSYLRAVVLPTGIYAAGEDWSGPDLQARIDRAAGELAALLTRRRAAVPEVAQPTAAAADPDFVPFDRLLADLDING